MVKEGKYSQDKPIPQWVNGGEQEFDEHYEALPNHDNDYRSHIFSNHPSGPQQ